MKQYTFSLFLLITLINHLLISSECKAQNHSETLLDDVLEDLSVHNDLNNSVNELHWEEELEALYERMQVPIDLNTATRKELQQLPFLNDFQIEQLLAYVYNHGGMKSLYELQLVEQMDQRTIRYLLPFVCLKDMNRKDQFQLKTWLKEARQYGRHQLLTRFDIPVYKSVGYQHSYLGPAVYNSVKYEFSYRDRLMVGMVGEKDAGEPFGALHNRWGYDYYSFYFFLQNMGRLKALALGNYRLSFGQGLVVSSDYLMGKSMYAPSFLFRQKGIRKHASTDETNYFCGVGTTWTLHRFFEASAFYSHRSMDGSVKEGKLTSIYTTGLHRSAREHAGEHAFTLQAAGGNVSYQQNNIHLGISGINYVFNRSYQPLLTGYSKYRLRGRKFYNVGFDYAWYLKHWSLQGETATGTRGWATLNRLQWLCSPTTSMLFIQRYYAHDYWAYFARAFGEGSTVQNEQGYYLGVQTSPFADWKFLAAVDWFAFPWKKYRISKLHSKGMETSLQADYSPDKRLSMYIRYRFKQKERDVSGSGGKKIAPTFQHRLRYRLNYSPRELFSCRTTIDYIHFHLRGQAGSQGYQATQALSFRLPRIPLQVVVQGSYFCTDDYDTRMYVSEKGLLHTFSTPSFYGHGFHCMMHLRCDLHPHWTFLAKWGQTFYQDRCEIGSGNDLIDGNKKATAQMQLRLKF